MSRSLQTPRQDAANYFSSDTKTASFLADALASGDTCVFLEALQTAARARGIAAIAEASGLGRESLYKALRPDAHPRFDTVRRVLEAMGINLNVSAQPVRARASHTVNEGRGRYALPASKRAARGKPAAPTKKAGAASAKSATKPAAKAASKSKATHKRAVKTRSR